VNDIRVDIEPISWWPFEDYPADGSGGSLIAWQNYKGMPCKYVCVLELEDGNYRLIPSGHYGVEFEVASALTQLSLFGYENTFYDAYAPTTFSFRIKNLSSSNSIVSPEVIETVRFINDLTEEQTNILPGLRIKLEPTIFDKEAFRVVIGGRWIQAERRVTTPLLFGNHTAATTPSITVRLKITNTTGYDITQLTVKVLNKISVIQGGLVLAANKTISSEIITTIGHDDPRPGFSSVFGDLVTRMTSNYSNLPARVYSPCDSENAYVPFSANGGQPNGSMLWLDNPANTVGYVLWDKWEIPDINPVDDSVWLETEPMPYALYQLVDEETVFLHYDFGAGNPKVVNRLGLMAVGIVTLKIYGSNDVADRPTSWDLISEVGDNTTQVAEDSRWWIERDTSVWPYIWPGEGIRFFVNFPNSVEYRHYKFVPTVVTLKYSPVRAYREIPAIARIELYTQETVVQNSISVPFSRIEHDLSVVSDPTPTPLIITFDNMTPTTTDLLVSNLGYDIIDHDTGQVFYEGKALVKGSKYRFSPHSPLSGMIFTLSSDLAEDMSAQVLVSPGAKAYEIESLDSGKWYRDGAPLELIESGLSLPINNTVKFDVRLNPGKGCNPVEGYPTEGVIAVVGITSGYEDPQQTSWPFAGVDNATGTWAFRYALDALTYSADEISIGAVIYNGGEILMAMVGLQGEGGNYLPGSKTFISWNGESSFTKTEWTYTTTWSDYVPFSNPDGLPVLITLVIQNFIGTESLDETVTQYTIPVDQATHDEVVVNLEKDTTISLLTGVRLRRKKKAISFVPLGSIVQPPIAPLTLDLNVLHSDFMDAMTELGVSFEELP
jgi:hypothetical protein